MKDLSGSAADWYARMGGSEQVLDAYRSSIIEMASMAVAIPLARPRSFWTSGTERASRTSDTEGQQ